MFLPPCTLRPLEHAHIRHSEMCVFILFANRINHQTFYYRTEIEERQDQLGGSDVAGKNAGFHIKKKKHKNTPRNN